MSTTINSTTSSSAHVTDDASNVDTPNDISLDSIRDSMCVTVNFSAFFHDESNDMVSTKASNIVNNVIHAVFIPTLFFIGFPSNILNLVVFFKHGLKQRINLCLFCLSLMDLLLMIFAFLMYAEELSLKDFTVSYRDVGYVIKMIVDVHLLACYSGFNLASQFVSVVISLERCLCVVWPLRSGTLLKTRTVGFILLAGILVLIGGRFIVAEKYSVVCMMDVVSGTTTLQLTSSEFHKTHKKWIDVMDGLLYGLAFPFTMCGFVIIATLVTAVKLQKSVEFQRQSSTSTASLSAREIALTRMLIYLSIQFIILTTPNFLFRVSILFLPKFNQTGQWANLYFLVLAIVEICGTLNSSLNILVYYFFGSKYRETAHKILGTCKRGKVSKELRVVGTNISS